jgi:hypothetical protein
MYINVALTDIIWPLLSTLAIELSNINVILIKNDFLKRHITKYFLNIKNKSTTYYFMMVWYTYSSIRYNRITVTSYLVI